MKHPLQWRLWLALMALTVMVTGCPHDEYTVELQPRGDVIQRTLTFFAQDGVDSNGVPNYAAFDTNALAAIAALYPAGAVTNSGARYIARGAFAGALPSDIGGAGSYSNFATSLGSASVYAERFRGNDDIATSTEIRLRAANELVDYTIGWSKAELGRQPHYGELRRFLDIDFRRDMKNFALYWWLGTISDSEKPDGGQEYIARGGQYLVEHGYLKLQDLPELLRAFEENDGTRVCRLVQRFVARKLDLPDSQPMPKALAFLADPDALDASWTNYLSTTPEYRHLLWEWHKKQILATWVNPAYLARNAGRALGRAVTNAPAPPRPEPHEVVDKITDNLTQFDYQPVPDTVMVNLSLPVPPLRTNGRWDAADDKVKWKHDIERIGEQAPLPAFFFAEWSEPDATYQTAHFGKVLLGGDDLMQYCLWHASLNSRETGEWDSFLAGLDPREGLANQLNNFRFSDEPPQTATNATGPSAFARELIKAGL